MNDNPSIVTIVEGDGEVGAAPGLIRRVLWERLGRYDISLLKPKRARGKSDLLKKFEKFLGYAIIENADAILVLLDADEECPVEKAVCLAHRASISNLGVPGGGGLCEERV